MPKRAQGLTAKGVQAIKAAGMFADGNGLYLQVSPGGAKSWIFRYQMAGKRREMGLGPVTLVSLAEAREKAQALRRAVFDGTDPLEAKKAREVAAVVASTIALTFRQAAAMHISAMESGWSSDKHAAQWSSSLETYAHPIIGDLPVSVIDTPLILRVIEPIWTEKTETASRVRGRIESVLDYAKVRGYRVGENPARWKGHLDMILPAKAAVAPVEHHTSLAYEGMQDFWLNLRAQSGMGARALEFCILTATRSGEVVGARWDEIDLNGAVWIIPADRMKARQEHRVPLSPAAIAGLKNLDRNGDYCFPGQTGGGPISGMTMTAVLRRMKVEATPHGFRSTFRTWAAEKTRFQHEVCEAALAHAIGDKVVAAYQRGDLFEKRRDLMTAWASFCEGKTIENVVALRREA